MFPSQGCQNTLRIAVLPNSSEQPPPPPKAFGTGFLLKKALHPERSDIRLVQTNEHVLNAAGKAPGAIVVIDASGIFALVSAVVFDTTLDLAVLLTKHPYDEREGLDIVDTDHIEVGSQVKVFLTTAEPLDAPLHPDMPQCRFTHGAFRHHMIGLCHYWLWATFLVIQNGTYSSTWPSTLATLEVLFLTRMAKW